MFPTILRMTNANKVQKKKKVKIVQNIERFMKMDFRVKCEKSLMGRNYNVKRVHIVNFCPILTLCKNFDNLS